jgi:DNA modification methylase
LIVNCYTIFKLLLDFKVKRKYVLLKICMSHNRLILGDNLEVLRSLPSESVDLIYLDPPFFSNRNYEVIWGDKGEVRSFKDRWEGGLNHYIGWLKERVLEMHRILKKTGSIYLHCDWHADAYIRVHILDPLFGEKNFRNEIVWENQGSWIENHNHFPRRHGNIFFYTKSDEYILNTATEDDINNGINFNRCYKYVENNKIYADNAPYQDSRFNVYVEKFKKVYKRNPNGKDIILDFKGSVCGSVWYIKVVDPKSKERIGYPTQKPEALLERIIKASSNKGDIVLDPFVGGGTTIAVADKLERNWIGIDSSVHAIKVSEQRIINNQIKAGERSVEKGQDSLLFKEKPFEVKLHKYDYDEIRKMDDRKFEFFIIEHFEAGSKVNPNPNKYYVDGYTKQNNIPIQVKRQDGVGIKIIDNMLSASRMEDKSRFEKLLSQNEPVAIKL